MAAAGTRSLAIRDAVAKMNGTAALREQAGHCRETGPHSMSCTSGRRAGRSRQSDAANARRASRPQDRFARELSFFAETGADPLPKLQFSSSRGASAWSITHDCGPGAAARAGNPDKTRNLPSADRTAFGAKAANGHACLSCFPRFAVTVSGSARPVQRGSRPWRTGKAAAWIGGHKRGAGGAFDRPGTAAQGTA